MFILCVMSHSIAVLLLVVDMTFLHFAWVVDDAKCIVVTHICVSVCLSAAACLHYCMDFDVTGGNGRGCLLVVHYWADLQSVHGLHCYGNITRNVSEYILVLALCLVCRCYQHYSTSYISVNVGSFISLMSVNISLTQLAKTL